MRKKSFVVIARSAFARKQSDNLLKSLKARLLRFARNDLSGGFSANCSSFLGWFGCSHGGLIFQEVFLTDIDKCEKDITHCIGI